MQKIRIRLIITGFLFCLIVHQLHAQSVQELSELKKQVEISLGKAITFFHSINIEGGYVYHYTLDLKEKWGEGKTDDHTIEVQPPGTPAVGMSFLRAYKITKNKSYLQAAKDAAFALIRGQNDLGGWEHKIYFNRPKRNNVSFDDDQTQRAISFLMALDQVMDNDTLSHAVEKSLRMMLSAQLDNGGWPHMYPRKGNYHDYATFNDEGINDCIRVMLEAHCYYGKEDYLQSLHRAGRFLMISQVPPPQPGWAQQYNEYLQPAWARSFEPPSICPLVTINNINSLIQLYLHTGHNAYLEPIPDAIRYLGESQLPNGKWGRFLELGTNKPLYYDRGRIRHDSLSQLSEERRTGYRYEVDLYRALADVKDLFECMQYEDCKAAMKDTHSNSSNLEDPREFLTLIADQVKQIIAAQDEQGRWIVKQDKFRKGTPGYDWKGEYRYEDRISSALFNTNVGLLCEYLEAYEGLE